MHMFTTRTLSGELYEVDTRLRPSGASGLLAINIATFADYQREEAWTWEHQALVRSRFVLGDDSLKTEFDKIRAEILSISRDENELVKDISSMRVKMYDNLAKESDEYFDLKQSRGGIADIEFISQFLVLNTSSTYDNLITFPDNIRILEQAAKAGLLSEEQTKQLMSAYLDYRGKYHHASLNGKSKVALMSEVEEQAETVKNIWQSIGLK